VRAVRAHRVQRVLLGWTKIFTDPRLRAAIVDRLTFGGTIIETGTDSYRLAQRTKLVKA
jgi:DNA replication protein DnaC